MQSSILEIVITAVVTGSVSSIGTVMGLKVDLKNLRDWVTRVDARAEKAHDKATETGGRVSVLENHMGVNTR